MKKVAHFYCYGTIGENDPLFKVFTGENDPAISSQKVIDFISSLEKDTTDITVHINSRGGNVDEGFAIHDLFKNSGKKVKTIIEGQCASIATVILFSGSEREATENATGLIHNPWIDPYMIAGLTADEIQKMANDVKQEEVRILDFYVKNTGADRATIESYMKEEKKFSANELLELKFITKIAEPVKAFAYHIQKNSNPQTMTLTKRLNKACAAFLTEMKGETTEVKASSKKTSDGKELFYEGAFEVGTKVFSDAEMKTATSDGSYTMEDESTVSVEAGAVKEITPKAEASAETPEQKEIAALKAEKTVLEKKVTDAEAAAEKAVKDTLAKFKSEFKPATSGTQFRKDEKLSYEDRKKALAEDLKKINYK